MKLRNSRAHYGAISKWLHWLTAVLVIFMLILGLTTSEFSRQWKPLALGVHESIGIIILSVTLLRVIWRLVNIQPSLPPNLAKAYVMLAKFSHFALYACLLAMPLSGWLMQSAAGRPVIIFGVYKLPDFIGPDHELGIILREAHGLIGYTLIGLIALHILAGFFHHFRLKDDVLRKMLPDFIFKYKQ